jgi:hypothetical protein
MKSYFRGASLFDSSNDHLFHLFRRWTQSKVVKIGLSTLMGPNAPRAWAQEMPSTWRFVKGMPPKISQGRDGGSMMPPILPGVAAALKLVSIRRLYVRPLNSPWPGNDPRSIPMIPFIVWGAIHPDITRYYKYPEVNRVAPTLEQENGPLCDWVIEWATRASASFRYEQLWRNKHRPSSPPKGSKDPLVMCKCERLISDRS